MGEPLRLGELCAGYGGLGMAVMDVLDAEVAWHCQYDPDDKHQYAAKILAHHWPDVPNHGDITAIDWAEVEPVDILTAGFPCQPVSNAGKRKGHEDDRWLWPDVASAIGVLRPRAVLFENVAAIVGRGLDRVLADLAALGLDAEWTCLRASDVGAPHRRERWFCLAWPTDSQGTRLEAAREGRPGGTAAAENGGQSRADTTGRGRASTADAHSPAGRQQLQRSRPGAVQGAEIIERPAEQSGRLHRSDRGQIAVDPAPADADDAGTFPQPDGEPAPSEGLDEHAELDPAGRVLGWGPYGPAIARWDRVMGRCAPSPTEPGKNGPRLAPVFVEWMQGLPAGHVTDIDIPRNAKLKALGNGVLPQQGAEALRRLLAHAPAWLVAYLTGELREASHA